MDQGMDRGIPTHRAQLAAILARHGVVRRDGTPIRADERPPFSISEGWLPLFDRLLADLVALGWSPRIIDYAKEKYGALSLFIPVSGELDARVDLAEEESERTCEECGAPGVLRETEGPYPWLGTRCDKHAGRFTRVVPPGAP